MSRRRFFHLQPIFHIPSHPLTRLGSGTHTAISPDQTLVQLRVTAAMSPAHWLDLEIRDDAKLESLDQFLRHIWLECRGHRSQFSIGDMD